MTHEKIDSKTSADICMYMMLEELGSLDYNPRRSCAAKVSPRIRVLHFSAFIAAMISTGGVPSVVLWQKSAVTAVV